MLFSVSMPSYLMLLAASISEDQLDAGDIGFSGLMVALVATTFVADQQQWGKYRPLMFLNTFNIDSILQTSKMQSRNIKRPPKYHLNIIERISTVVLMWSVFGLGVVTPISQRNSHFG